MPDREVVITHPDDLRLFADVTVHPVVSPDNWDVYSSLCDYIDQIKTEVEILLKEQEAESVIDIADAVDGIEVGRCPSCDKGIVNKKSDPTRYCKFCGQAVKWNDKE